MKISVAMVVVLVDTLRGSGAIQDASGSVFSFTRETREQTLNHLLKALGDVYVDVAVAQKPVKNESALAVALRPLLAAWDRGDLPKGEFEGRVRETVVSELEGGIEQEAPKTIAGVTSVPKEESNA